MIQNKENMYNLDILLKLKELNISIKHYLLLKLVEDSALFHFRDEYLELIVDMKFNNFLTNTEEITTKGLELLAQIEGKKKEVFNYSLLYNRLQLEFVKLTGQKQYMVDGKYAFFPNLKDFGDKIKSIILKYKLKDMEKVEKLLLLHIQKSYKANFKFTTLLKYYISKDNKSMLVDDYENFVDDLIIQQNKNFDGINI